MTLLKDRRDTFEKRFVHEQELRFKSIARRNRLLGLWAAERLGKLGPDAEAYARSVVISDLDESGDADVIQKVTTDLAAIGVKDAEDEVRKALERLMTIAIKEIQSDSQ